jgi:FecR protein/Putative zinc-finger
MTPEFEPIDPALETAVEEIRNESVDSAVIEAAAGRVWARLAPEAVASLDRPIRGCADFQALLPDYRAGRLPSARAALVQDHLHECVDCRHVYHGDKTVVMPATKPAVRPNYTVRWAIAAAVVATAGASVWLAVDQFGAGTGRALVETANGRLYYLGADGVHALGAGQDLPEGVEIRTAAASTAMLRLRDGSELELRERSGFAASGTADDLTVRLERGSVLVHAARRRKGHLYVSTADCRVAVTGTVFSVTAGVKGSRVSVIEGEVHVSQDNQERILHPGDQAVTSPNIQPVSVREDIAWSRDRDTLYKALESLKSGIQQIHLPALRYQSRLLAHLPASTEFFASIPNLSAYLAEAQTVLHARLAESPELREWWESRGANIEPILEKLRAASDYLGEEVDIVSFAGPDGKPLPPALIAEVRRDGFADFLHQNAPKLEVRMHGAIVVFGPVRESVEGLAASLDSSTEMQGTPFFARIQESFRNGAGILLCADLMGLGHQPVEGLRYVICEQKEIDQQMEVSASLGFDGPRTGIASWLAEPSPMGSLEYISPDATVVFAATVKSPAAILDETVGLQQRSPEGAQKVFGDIREQTGIDVRQDLAGNLGNEFSISLDGPAFPVPAVKLAAEVYDPVRFQDTVQKAVEAYNQHAAATGNKPLRTAQETFEGRVYYMIGGADPNPLTEVHYTYADGYLIAGLSRAVVARALQVKTSGVSITHSARFVAMEPRDQHANFSLVMYQNLGTTLAPLVNLLGAFVPAGRAGQANGLQALGNMKPLFIAAYGEPDRITVSGQGNALSKGIGSLISGNIMGVVGDALPLGQFSGTNRPQHSLSR